MFSLNIEIFDNLQEPSNQGDVSNLIQLGQEYIKTWEQLSGQKASTKIKPLFVGFILLQIATG